MVDPFLSEVARARKPPATRKLLTNQIRMKLIEKKYFILIIWLVDLGVYEEVSKDKKEMKVKKIICKNSFSGHASFILLLSFIVISFGFCVLGINVTKPQKKYERKTKSSHGRTNESKRNPVRSPGHSMGFNVTTTSKIISLHVITFIFFHM